jgi:3-methyladenine DNA glycosylase AlkD
MYMSLSEKAKSIVTELSSESVKLGDIKKIAKEIKCDHELALELWSTGEYFPRMLSVLIFDKKSLTQNLIDQLTTDMSAHNAEECNQLVDWFLANQLMKNNKLVSLLETWRLHASPMLRRLFWYHQARLRWVGQEPPPNTESLLQALEADMSDAEPQVQWAMNFCAGQIGVHQAEFRDRCIKLGETTGLYRDEKVARNCVPSYLPEFIRIEVAKRE